MRKAIKFFFCGVILSLTPISTQADNPLNDPFNPQDYLDTGKPDDPIIDNFQMIEDPSLEPYSIQQWGL